MPARFTARDWRIRVVLVLILALNDRGWGETYGNRHSRTQQIGSHCFAVTGYPCNNRPIRGVAGGILDRDFRVRCWSGRCTCKDLK